MEYKVVVTMAQAEFDRVNGLLDIECLDDMTDEEHTILCPFKFDNNHLFSYEFNNGNFISASVNSGGSNYYDNYVLFDKDGYELMVLDCSYEVEKYLEFEYEGDKYIIEIEFEK